MSTDFKPTAYIKDGCPFSFKYLVFMAETGRLGEIEIVRLRDGDPEMAATKERLSAKLGKPMSFPTVEIEPDRYLADSDRLIEHFAAQRGQRPADLPVLSFYKETILPKLFELHKLKTAKS